MLGMRYYNTSLEIPSKLWMWVREAIAGCVFIWFKSRLRKSSTWASQIPMVLLSRSSLMNGFYWYDYTTGTIWQILILLPFLWITSEIMSTYCYCNEKKGVLSTGRPSWFNVMHGAEGPKHGGCFSTLAWNYFEVPCCNFHLSSFPLL